MSGKDGTIRRPKGLDEDWKRRVSETLRKCGLVDSEFTGTVEISLCSGGVAGAKKQEVYR